ncbi:MAG: hypothetical protein IT513_07715 [Burkholderiales bacterium]|nr:hypothetical protein [Burkholderiales bacterium]
MAVALLVSLSWKPVSYVEQLIRIQAEQELGQIDPRILEEPAQVQAVLLDYAANQELVLKAWIALSKYPASAREILLLYGSEPEFRDILRRYGDAVVPVIQYFRDHDVWTIRAIDTVSSVWKDLRDRLTGGGQAKPGRVALGPAERGWYAVHFIKVEGYDFLGQFSVPADGKARWNQTDRIVKASTSFFTSGVRSLETRIDLGLDVTAADAFWAGLDVALVAVPAKLLLSGRVVARSGQELGLAARTRLVAPRLLPKGEFFRKLGAYGVAAATLYVVARHPSLLNSVLAELAGLMGVSPWIVQAAGWSVVIVFLVYLFSWLLAPLARIMLFLLRHSGRSPRPA